MLTPGQTGRVPEKGAWEREREPEVCEVCATMWLKRVHCQDSEKGHAESKGHTGKQTPCQVPCRCSSSPHVTEL